MGSRILVVDDSGFMRKRIAEELLGSWTFGHRASKKR